MKYYKIKSYAKINISLRILGKLKSKFHKIESLFYPKIPKTRLLPIISTF